MSPLLVTLLAPLRSPLVSSAGLRSHRCRGEKDKLIDCFKVTTLAVHNLRTIW